MSTPPRHLEKSKRVSLRELSEALEPIYRDILAREDQSEQVARTVHPDHHLSAKNLMRYLILRSHDLRRWHDPLSELGLSSLRSGEGYVLSNLHRVLEHLHRIAGSQWDDGHQEQWVGFRKSRELMERNTAVLFDQKKPAVEPEIMVTLSKGLSDQPEELAEMIRVGMSVTRINLARNNRETWEKMLESLEKATEATGRNIPIYMDLGGPKIRTKFPKDFEEQWIPAAPGSKIFLQRERVSADEFKQALEHSEQDVVINVSLPRVLNTLSPGDPLSFEDGKVQAIVEQTTAEGVWIRITQSHRSRLKRDKGMNIPGQDLGLPSLTKKDIENLEFVCSRADIVGYSFVNTAEDVRDLYDRLDQLGATELGVVLKIETAQAFSNLPSILIEGMKRKRVGVMVARGDLAVEVGFDRISEVQHEILWFCEAAHIPVIWATQVLDSLAKKGLATRAEISDATLGTRAECIMLNKGPHIREAIAILKTILDRMKDHVSKKKDTSRPLNVAQENLERLLGKGEYAVDKAP